MEIIVGILAVLAGAKHCGVLAEIKLQTFVKDIERTFPKSLVLECLAIAKDSSINLVHLVESSVLHDEREDLAANTTGAVRDDRPVLQMVVLATFQFLDEIRRVTDVGHNCILEPTNACFELVAAIEEDHILSAFIDEFMHLCRAEMLAATDYSVRTKNNLVGNAKGDYFVTHPHRQPREIVSDTFRPFVIDVIEGRKLTGDSSIFLDQIHWSADRAINSILGKDDATFQSEAFAQCTLPQTDRLGVGQGSELVEQKNLDVYSPILAANVS